MELRRLFFVILGIALGMVMAVVGLPRVHGADRQCTAQQRVEMAASGYTKTQINDLCGEATEAGTNPKEPFPILSGEGQPRWVQWCVTPQGKCSLNTTTSGLYPLGAPCNCYMPWGSYSGTAQ